MHLEEKRKLEEKKKKLQDEINAFEKKKSEVSTENMYHRNRTQKFLFLVLIVQK